MKAIVTLRCIHYDRDLYPSNQATVGWIDAFGEVGFEGLAIPGGQVEFHGRWYDTGTDVGYDDSVLYDRAVEALLPIRYHRRIVAKLSSALWAEASQMDGRYPDLSWLRDHGFKRDLKPDCHPDEEFVWEGERTVEIDLS